MSRMTEQRVVSYLGNFSVSYSTESHVALSLESLGHHVVRIQEGETPATEVADIVRREEADLLLWTQTYGLAVSGGTIEERFKMLDDIRSLGVPSVGYHLDLWWGLDRAEQLEKEPYFRVDYLFSTDGGHDEEWKHLGINHHWLPPGVVHTEAVDGTPRPEYMSDIAFVGSRNYGHKEHAPVRTAMLNALRRRYRRRFKMWPVGQAIRGMDLTDLYASVKVVVGDSCLAGHVPWYWSDRVPETMGRGGLLVHPNVQGLTNVHPWVLTYEPGNWEEMFSVIDRYLQFEDERESVRVSQAEDTRARHTYRNRMESVLNDVLNTVPA